MKMVKASWKELKPARVKKLIQESLHFLLLSLMNTSTRLADCRHEMTVNTDDHINLLEIVESLEAIVGRV